MPKVIVKFRSTEQLNQKTKMVIEPIVTPTKTKITLKPHMNQQLSPEPVSDPKKIVIKIKGPDVHTEHHENKCSKVKLLVTRKISDGYIHTTSGEIKKPIPVPHDPIELPERLELESFLYQNNDYWIEINSGYIFLPNDIQSNNIEPIGKLIEKAPSKKITEHFYPLPNRRIEWYLKYELDTVV